MTQPEGYHTSIQGWLSMLNETGFEIADTLFLEFIIKILFKLLHFVYLPLPNNEFVSNTFQIRSPSNSLTKHFWQNRYWAESVYFNGPSLVLKFAQESAGHNV